MQTTLTLDAALRDLAGQLRDDISGMVERGLAQQRLVLPEFFVRDDDPDFVEVYRQSYQQQLRFIYDGLESGRDLEGYEVPPLALEEARMSANLGINLGSVLLGYRVSQRLIFDEAIVRGTDPVRDRPGLPRPVVGATRARSADRLARPVGSGRRSRGGAPIPRGQGQGGTRHP
jgi:hypothetical protein